jgi:superfamily I DNA and/or RNA helicase
LFLVVDLTSIPVVFIDTTGQERDESSDSSGSKFNQQEAEIVFLHVKELLKANVDPSYIGIISPYQAQVQLISSLLKEQYPEIECSSGNPILLSQWMGFKAEKKRL